MSYGALYPDPEVESGDSHAGERLSVPWLFYGRSQPTGHATPVRDFWSLAAQNVPEECISAFYEMCAATFHPASGLLPRVKIYLFWRLKGADAPYCFTRVQSFDAIDTGSTDEDKRNPADYSGVLLYPKVLSILGGDPFAAERAGWLDMARERALAGDRTSLKVSPPLPEEEAMPDQRAVQIFQEGGQGEFDESNLPYLKRQLSLYSTMLAREGSEPFTFATYWPRNMLIRMPPHVFRFYLVLPLPPRADVTARNLSRQVTDCASMMGQFVQQYEVSVLKLLSQDADIMAENAERAFESIGSTESSWRDAIQAARTKARDTQGRLQDWACRVELPDDLKEKVQHLAKGCEQLGVVLTHERHPITNNTIADIVDEASADEAFRKGRSPGVSSGTQELMIGNPPQTTSIAANDPANQTQNADGLEGKGLKSTPIEPGPDEHGSTAANVKRSIQERTAPNRRDAASKGSSLRDSQWKLGGSILAAVAAMLLFLRSEGIFPRVPKPPDNAPPGPAPATPKPSKNGGAERQTAETPAANLKPTTTVAAQRVIPQGQTVGERQAPGRTKADGAQREANAKRALTRAQNAESAQKRAETAKEAAEAAMLKAEGARQASIAKVAASEADKAAKDAANEAAKAREHAEAAENYVGTGRVAKRARRAADNASAAASQATAAAEKTRSRARTLLPRPKPNRPVTAPETTRHTPVFPGGTAMTPPARPAPPPEPPAAPPPLDLHSLQSAQKGALEAAQDAREAAAEAEKAAQSVAHTKQDAQDAREEAREAAQDAREAATEAENAKTLREARRALNKAQKARGRANKAKQAAKQAAGA